jgi:LmbE family N-acetylglucosaminyl deacetylase
MKDLDALFFGAHPDDVELTSAGLAARLASHGHAIGIVDLTRGEAASAASPRSGRSRRRTRAQPWARPSASTSDCPILGLDRSDHVQLRKVAGAIRTHRPRLVVAPHHDDAASRSRGGAHLVARACYSRGPAELRRARRAASPGAAAVRSLPHRSRAALVVDVTRVWEQRSAALATHRASSRRSRGPRRHIGARDLSHPPRFHRRSGGARPELRLPDRRRYGEGYRTRGPVAIHDARA